MSDNIEMQNAYKYYQTDNNYPQSSQLNINSNNVDTLNSNNSLCGESSQIIQNFYKVDIKEIGPTTQDIKETIFEEDLNIVINELINLCFEEVLNKKQFVLDYFNIHKINLQEIYNWILNNETTSSNSIYLLGYFNYHGIGTNINKKNAFELYKKAADLGNLSGMCNLGRCYELGDGIGVNKQKAFELYQKVADLGFAYGIYYLGRCYKKGIGTNIDTKKAFELYKKAADLGHLYGMNNLGCCYDGGIGTDVNKQKAFELFQKAANLGNDMAQYNIALMYKSGDGIEKNVDQAIYWFKKSAEQGDQEAQNKLNKLLKINEPYNHFF